MAAIWPVILTAATLAAPIDDPVVPAGDAQRCELHVWPADGMTSVRQRASESNRMAGIIPEAIRQAQKQIADIADAEAAARLAGSDTPDPLSTARQTEILGSLPLADLMKLPGYQIVIHTDTLDSVAMRTSKARHATSAATCYAELVLSEVVYSREYARGRNLKALFRFRHFDDGAAPRHSFGTWTQTKLDLFSLDPLRADGPALDELASALRSNVILFSSYLERGRQTTAITKGGK